MEPNQIETFKQMNWIMLGLQKPHGLKSATFSWSYFLIRLFYNIGDGYWVVYNTHYTLKPGYERYAKLKV